VDTEQTDKIISLIDSLVGSSQIPTDLKWYVLEEFAGNMVFTSLAISKRRCQLEDERDIAYRADALIAALAPFLHAAILKDDKVRELTQILEYFTPLLQRVTEGRKKLAGEGEEHEKRYRRPAYL